MKNSSFLDRFARKATFIDRSGIQGLMSNNRSTRENTPHQTFGRQSKTPNLIKNKLPPLILSRVQKKSNQKRVRKSYGTQSKQSNNPSVTQPQQSSAISSRKIAGKTRDESNRVQLSPYLLHLRFLQQLESRHRVRHT